MRKLHHVNVFSDLGVHYIQGSDLGEVYDTSILHTSSGTHVVTSAKGCIYTFLQKDDTTTGSEAVKTDILSSICCALNCSVQDGRDEASDKMVILGAVGTTVQLMEQDGESIKQPYTADVKAPRDATSLQKYFPLETTEGYKVLTLYKNSDGETMSLGYFELRNGHITAAADTGITVTSPQISWVKQDGEDCVLYEFDGESYIDFPLPSYNRLHKICSPRLRDDAKKSRIIGAFEDQYFVIDEDGMISACDLQNLEESGCPQMTVQTGDGTISAVSVFRAYGTIQLLAFSKENGRLYHCPLVSRVCNAENVCIPLAENVLQYSVDNGGNYIHLSLVCGEKKHPKLVHYALSADGNEWTDNHIYFESQTDVQSIQGHIIELTLCDSDGSPLANQEIKLWSNEDTALYIDGRVLRTGPNIPYIVKSSPYGTIEVVKESDSLDMPPIILQHVDDNGDTTGSYFMVTPGEKYKDKFQNISGGDLDEAVTGTGDRLVEDDFNGHREEVLSSAADAFSSILSGTAVSDNPDLMRIKEDDWYPDQSNSLKVTSYREDPTPFVGKLPSTNSLKSCIISVSDGKLSYRSVTPQEAQQHIRGTYCSVYGNENFMLQGQDASALTMPGASNGFFSAIASLFRSIKNGIVKVVEVVVHAVETAVTATIHFIDNAIHQVVNFVVTAVKEAVHLVESVLKQIAVAIKNVIQWIGFMLDWGDIQNTAKYVEKKFEEGFDQIERMLDDALQCAESGIEGAEEKIHEYFKRFKTDLPDHDIKDGSNTPPTDDPINQADAHNIVKKHLGDSDVALQTNFLGFSTEEEQAFTDMITISERVSDVCVFDPSELFDSLQQNKVSIKTIGDCLINMVETFLHAALELTKEVMHTLVSAVKVIIHFMRGLLTAKIHIPLVSALIKAVIGMDLTLLNAASFAIALPLTVAYKLIYHKAPVQKQAALCGDDAYNLLRILGTFCISLVLTAKTLTAGFMCLKTKPLILFSSILGLIGVAGFAAASTVCLSPKVVKGVFGFLFALDAVLFAVDAVYSKRGFNTEHAYYSLRRLIYVGGLGFSVISLIIDIAKTKDAFWLFATPGGILSLAQDVTCEGFYRNRPGENWPLVAACGAFGVIIAALTPVLILNRDDNAIAGADRELCEASSLS